MNGYLTKEGMRERMDSVDIHFIDSPDDCDAFRHFKKYYPLVGMIRRMKERKSKA